MPAVRYVMKDGFTAIIRFRTLRAARAAAALANGSGHYRCAFAFRI